MRTIEIRTSMSETPLSVRHDREHADVELRPVVPWRPGERGCRGVIISEIARSPPDVSLAAWPCRELEPTTAFRGIWPVGVV